MFKIISIILISTFSLFANETFRSIEELSPNDKQIKEMKEKKQLEEEKSSLFGKVILPELEKYGEKKSYFKDKTNAIIIGEETSGKPNHYGYVKSFTLPYSEIKVRYSSEFWKLTEDNDVSIVPDVKIENSYNDYKNGIDPVFEYVKKN